MQVKGESVIRECNSLAVLPDVKIDTDGLSLDGTNYYFSMN